MHLQTLIDSREMELEALKILEKRQNVLKKITLIVNLTMKTCWLIQMIRVKQKYIDFLDL